MATQPNIEFEAAKFLQKLIQDSRDEPAKLATKLYVILQHMKASGKEHSMPFQVISRAMETVVNQHGLDIESLKPPRMPSGGYQAGDCSNSQLAGCPQVDVASQGTQSSMLENDSRRNELFSSGRPPSVPNSVALDSYPGSVPHRSVISFEHESPSSVDMVKSANSNELLPNQKDATRSSSKRKRPDSLGSESHLDNQQLDMHGGRLINNVEIPGSLPGVENYGKSQAAASACGPYSVIGGFSGASSLDSASAKATVDPEYWKQGFMRGTVTNLPERQVQEHGVSTNKTESPMGSLSTTSETNTRSAASRDAGKLPMGPSLPSSMPFKDHHLKQLRAQCLVFLAFRNGLMPKRLHLEIALGNNIPKAGIGDGSQREFGEYKGKEEAIEPANIPKSTSLQANVSTMQIERVPAPALVDGSEAYLSGIEADNVRVLREKSGSSLDARVISEEQKELPPAKHMEPEMHGQLMSGTSGSLLVQPRPDSSNVRTSDDLDSENDNMQGGVLNHVAPAIGLSKQSRSEMMRHAGIGITRELSRGPSHTSDVQQDLMPRIIDSSSNQTQGAVSLQGSKQFDKNSSLHWRPIQGVNVEHPSVVPLNDANMSLKYVSHEPEEADKLRSAGVPPPKYTTTDKWIMIQQKKRRVNEDNWALKHQKVDQRIAERFSKLKETVSSSDDISAKTRSVIELKKLQLLQLQRRLRSNIMNDFFKSITMEVDRLKSIKKHRIGRRLKHVEKYEQRMKEERQKRIRERQKEFFSDVELHKERLDDVFKYKKERWRGFNRYVKEFHKRKERLHREKLDRIQREKINLLKINDVEGYLRMVQDAKSDRVKQLLKETEKYLQKLGAKLQEAKSLSRQFENEMDESQSVVGIECNEYFGETEDENDQAKHYKESNEKYYMIAHSIKEIVTEQPAGLQGGKLREYQMNGLRWLVSLYNNHLNGILADEMGLGKTVQVISLICYLMETKNDRGPFLVVVPSSVLPGWDSEINSWAPGVNKIVYAGPPEERRRLFKECIVHQKFNVLLTTYEYLMNKHDRPKLSKIHWHYVIIDEGHRIKNASCKLNADLKHYQSSHRLLLTGTPLQNSLEELWALLNFLLPNIFNSSEDFSQWFNKPFESNGDNSPDEALLSEEENLLIINRLHQVLRPFVLRRLKHKVENELPEKIERLVRCEASAYQKLLMKRVEENLGSLVNSKARSVHNSVMELRNICNHPYLSQLHVEDVETLIPKHFLPPIVRLCGKLEMLDRLLPKLKATGHRVLFFSTMTRLLDVMEDYLTWKQYRYLRLDGHTSGNDRGALIDQFNHPDSPYFIFLLSIRAGGVGVNLQAADTVIIFDTDWNPQVDLQAQARAHRIGQKKDVLVLRLETVNTVEEQVRASAEHKLGVANQSITAGFFDNNTSAEDRREYLESLLRESKKEEAAPVLEDDSLNDLLARSESEIDVFEAIDQERREDEMATWKRLVEEQGINGTDDMPPLPNRLVLDEDLKEFYEAMKVYEVAASDSTSNVGLKRKGGTTGSYDTQHYGRGKRAREVRSYEEQWTEEEFEKICQAEFLETHKAKEQQMVDRLHAESGIVGATTETPSPRQQPLPTSLGAPVLINNEVSPPVKRGRGRPRRIPLSVSPPSVTSFGSRIQGSNFQNESVSSMPITSTVVSSVSARDTGEAISENVGGMAPKPDTTTPPNSIEPVTEKTTSLGTHVSLGRGRGSGRRGRGRGEAGTGRGRGRKPSRSSSSGSAMQNSPLELSVKPSGPDINIAPIGLTSDIEAVNPTPLPHNQTNVGATCSAVTSSVSPSTGVTGFDIEPNKSLIGLVHSVVPTPTSSSLDSRSKRQAGDSSNVEISTDSAATPGSRDLSILGNATPPSTSFVHSTVGATSGLAVPVCESPMSVASDVAPSKRRGRRPHDGADSVQQRVRKQSQATPFVNTTSSQPVRSSEASLLPEPTSFQAPQGSVSVSVESQLVSVLMNPDVLVSGIGPDSAAVIDAGGVVHVPSVGLPVIASPSPKGSQGISCSQSDFPHFVKYKEQNLSVKEGEKPSRRIGRKKRDSLASASPSNVSIQDKNPSDAKGTLGTVVEKDSATSSHVQCSLEVKKLTAQDVSALDASSKSREVLCLPVEHPKQIDDAVEGLSKESSGSTVKFMTSSPNVANFSPTRSKAENETSLGRKVTTIVLALKTSSFIDLPESNSADLIGEEKCSMEQQHISAPPEEVLFYHHGAPHFKTNVVSNTVAQQDEEILPPPGFETKLSVASENILVDPGQIREDGSVPPGFCVSNVSPSNGSVMSTQIDRAETPGSEEKKEDSEKLIGKDIVSGDVGVICSKNEILVRSNIDEEPERNLLVSDKPVESGACPLSESMHVDAIMDKNGKGSADVDALVAQEKKDLVLQETSVSDMEVDADKRESVTSPASDHKTFEFKGGKNVQEMVDMQKRVPHGTVPSSSENKGIDTGLELLGYEPENTKKVSLLGKQSEIIEPGIDASLSDMIRASEGTPHGQGENCDDKRPHALDGSHSSIGTGAAAVLCTSIIEGGDINKAKLAQNVVETVDSSRGTTCNVVELKLTGGMSTKDDAQIEQHTYTDEPQTSVGCISPNAPVVSKDDGKPHGSAAADVDSKLHEEKGSINKASLTTKLAENSQATLEASTSMAELKMSNDQSKDDQEDDTFVKEGINDVTWSSLGPELDSAPVHSTLSSKNGEEQNELDADKTDMNTIPSAVGTTESREIADKSVGTLIALEKDGTSGNLSEDCRKMANILNCLGREISLCLNKESAELMFTESVSRGDGVNNDMSKETVARPESSNAENEIVQPLLEKGKPSNKNAGENVGEPVKPVMNIETGEPLADKKNVEIVAEPAQLIINNESDFNAPSLKGSNDLGNLDEDAGLRDVSYKDTTSKMDIDESVMMVESIKVSDTDITYMHETCEEGCSGPTSSIDDVEHTDPVKKELCYETKEPVSTFSECQQDEVRDEKQCVANDTSISPLSEAANSKPDRVMGPDKGNYEGPKFVKNEVHQGQTAGAGVARRERECGTTDDNTSAAAVSHTLAEPVISCKVEKCQGADVSAEGDHGQKLNDDIPSACSESSDALTDIGTATTDIVAESVPELTGTSGTTEVQEKTQKPIAASETLSDVYVAGNPPVGHIDGNESQVENSRASVQKTDRDPEVLCDADCVPALDEVGASQEDDGRNLQKGGKPTGPLEQENAPALQISGDDKKDTAYPERLPDVDMEDPADDVVALKESYEQHKEATTCGVAHDNAVKDDSEAGILLDAHMAGPRDDNDIVVCNEAQGEGECKKQDFDPDAPMETP